MGRALSSTDYRTITGFPTLVAPVHAFGFAPGSGTETAPPPLLLLPML